MTGVDDAAVARRALGLLDLTELGDRATAEDVATLCERAVGPHGAVAAVCVWPRFVTQARDALEGTGVRIATVTNFPSGAEQLVDVLTQTTSALEDGADDLDVVLPYRQLASGDERTPAELVERVRAVVPSGDGQLLKVILETGELVEPALIDRAARLAIGAGADFVKTSTGKTSVSATLEATAIMLAAIKELDPRVGLKPSGGIRALADARAYLEQADAAMGPEWVSWRTFRFGASGLLDALVAAIRGDAAPTAGTPTY
jgi:deoxyribose-phosphate aldolase